MPNAILNYISKVQQNGMPDHTIWTKLGSVYRLLRNLSVNQGLVKNTHVITGISQKLIAIH